MGDMGDMYRDREADKKAKGEKRESVNQKIIQDWLMNGNIKHCDHISDRGGTILFRFPGKPKIDFYPTKNKWRKGRIIYWGDVSKFLKWYDGQENHNSI